MLDDGLSFMTNVICIYVHSVVSNMLLVVIQLYIDPICCFLYIRRLCCWKSSFFSLSLISHPALQLLFQLSCCSSCPVSSSPVSGCAFVTFSSRTCAVHATKEMHHSQTMEVVSFLVPFAPFLCFSSPFYTTICRFLVTVSHNWIRWFCPIIWKSDEHKSVGYSDKRADIIFCF